MQVVTTITRLKRVNNSTILNRAIKFRSLIPSKFAQNESTFLYLLSTFLTLLSLGVISGVLYYIMNVTVTTGNGIPWNGILNLRCLCAFWIVIDMFNTLWTGGTLLCVWVPRKHFSRFYSNSLRFYSKSSRFYSNSET